MIELGDNADFSRRLLVWYRSHGRHDLPWKAARDSYPIWVSEIMLQQTQAATVIPYFERFMASFPRITDLADAAEDEVLHHWSGLGYYARARNLYRCAQQVCDQYNGQLPLTVEGLQALPGIGRSTAGAIVALATDQRAVILDGNVKRVLARHAMIPGWSGHSATQTLLWERAEQYTPQSDVADYTQAIMDLGATICTRSKPQCGACPLNEDCLAHNSGRVAEFPAPKPKVEKPVKQVVMLMLMTADCRVLVEKRPMKGIWGGLWSFPECGPDQWLSHVADCFGVAPHSHESWPAFRHTFTHYHLDIHPVLIRVSTVFAGEQHQWISCADPPNIGLPAPVSLLLSRLSEYLMP